MKFNWTKEEIMDNRGCYSENQVEGLSFINNGEITLLDILESEISIRDKVWFIRNKSELKHKKELAFLMAKSVAVIFNSKYPDDNRVNACLEGIEKFNQGLISRHDLLILRNHAAAAANNAYDDYHYYNDNNDAAAAYDAAAAAANAANAANDNAANAANAHAANAAHTIELQTVIINFIKSQL